MNVTTLASLTGGKVITADIDSDAEDFVNFLQSVVHDKK